MNSQIMCMLLTSVITLTPPQEAPVSDYSQGQQIEILADNAYGTETLSDPLDGIIETMSVEAVETTSLPDSFCLNVGYVPQYPELPTGCEAAALTMVLNYLGYSVDKCTIADVHMPKGKKFKTDPKYVFIGEPHDEIEGWGSCAPAIVTTANSYLSSVGESNVVLNLSGTDLDTLCRGIYDFGRPVIVWGSSYMQPITDGKTWYADGKKITWRKKSLNKHGRM